LGRAPILATLRPEPTLRLGAQPCEELGMQALGQRTLAWVAAWPRGPAVRHANVAGLTDREVEVLCLVAQRRTNRVIAVALVLSEKTVARHLTTIFSKTGLENRAGAVSLRAKARSGLSATNLEVVLWPRGPLPSETMRGIALRGSVRVRLRRMQLQ
jgi:DNA-binding CsgD family transcriptional regulator